MDKMKTGKQGPHRLPSLCILALWVIAACNRRDSPVDSKVISVFSDFSFVGSAPYTSPAEKDTKLNFAVGAHGEEPQPLPTQLELGKEYIFHHTRPVDNEQLALSVLPSRLRMAGLTIVDAPKSSRDLMFPFIGGPLFVIEFADSGRHKGFIFDRPSAHRHGKEWPPEDYVLVYTK